ncbi:Glycine receptor subunit beta [Fasciola gigantica]|uniref:Glycine receptor subunit beta n=1 Tax=Fasciola gigantica TaxID=46835 RepID=A0A504Y981_FASGI|nr:Glycine receptor subunit beta [Fasciola gigantica]
MWQLIWYAVFGGILFLSKTKAIVLNTSSLRDEIVETLFADYQSHVRPGELIMNQTVVVVYISISAITSVDVRNMEYTMDMLLRQTWKDPRLSWDHDPKFAHYKKNIVSPVFKDKIWLPDLFFRNGKEGRLHKMTCENLLIRIQPNGEVLYSQKITMRFSCTMELHTFPMDTQNCGMDIGSYGYTLEQLRFIWHNQSPVTLPPDLQISEFDPPKKVTPHDCSSLYQTSTGQYTCLNATFVLSRQLGYWLASTYIPNILIMVVSWLNFWVSVEATPARVNLSLLTLLGVITQSTSFASSLPRVSYIKAIDVWTTACITFNSGVLLEFAIASHVSRRKKVSEWQNEVRKTARSELARWCTACQQQYQQRGPSAFMAYLSASGGRRSTTERTSQYINSASAAATAMDNSAIPDSPTQMSVRMTKSGLMALVSEKASPYKSPRMDKKRATKADMFEQAPGEPGLHGLEAAQTDALLPPSIEAKKPAFKPPSINEIDSYSRFLFPACFLIYNCFYWLYYLVLVKQAN